MSHLSPKIMLLKGQHALKERVANDMKKTKKKEDGRRANSSKRKRPAVESDSDTTAGSEAYEEKPATKKEEGRGEIEARAYNQTRQRRRKAQRRVYRHNGKHGTKVRA